MQIEQQALDSIIHDLRYCGNTTSPLSQCSKHCTRNMEHPETVVDPMCAGRLMLDAADALEVQSCVSVRCYRECHWMHYDPGSFYEPPSSECTKENDLDALRLVAEYTEYDEDVDVPDCPFHITFEDVRSMYHEYIVFDSEPEAIVNTSEEEEIEIRT